MSRMITTKDKIVEEIMATKERQRDAERVKQEKIRENWKTIKAQGFGYAKEGMTPVDLNYEDGRMLYDILPDGAWKDQRCFIIGGGESLKKFDFSKLKNELVIGVNRAYEKMDCTINFAMDYHLYHWIIEGKLGEESKKKFLNFNGIPVWLDTAGYDYPKGIYILGKSPGIYLNYYMKGGISGGTNSGFGALGLAACLGANPIYLLGFDMKGTRWHDGYPEDQGERKYKSFINDFKKSVQGLKEKGFQVINLSEDSELKCFEFGKFKDIKPIDHPVIVSYYTKGTAYETQVDYLKATLRRFNLENDVVGIPDMGSWHKNTYYKAQFILKMMKKHSGRSIVFVDADARICRNPLLFNDLDCDFACHFRQKKELLSGTLYFGNTKGSRYLVDKWIEEDKKHPRTHMPQKNLRNVFDKNKGKIKWKELPVEYCMIFDSQARHDVNPVVEHFQLSRQHKKKSPNPYHYSMGKGIQQIQEFCKGKNICLVGNSNSILNKRRRIDRFDIVGRMNRGTPKGKEQFIGGRTDILFLSTHMSGKSIQDAFSPRFVMWMTVCHRLASSWVLKNAIQNPKKDWSQLYNKLSINPTTGLMALNFLLKWIKFKSLTIYGFDFFATKTWYNTRIDSGQKHSGIKEKALILKMIKGRSNVRLVK